MKVCKRCEMEKPYTEYNKAAGMKDGHKSICKSCLKKQRAGNEVDLEVNKETIIKIKNLLMKIKACKFMIGFDDINDIIGYYQDTSGRDNYPGYLKLRSGAEIFLMYQYLKDNYQ